MQYMVTSTLITCASSPSVLKRMRPENPQPIAVKYSSSAKSGRNVEVSHGWQASKEVPVDGRSLLTVQGSSAHAPLESFCGDVSERWLETEAGAQSIVRAVFRLEILQSICAWRLRARRRLTRVL